MIRYATILFLLCISGCSQSESNHQNKHSNENNHSTIHVSAEIDSLVDHHTHIFSPLVNQWMEDVLDRSLPPYSTEQLVTVLREDNVAKAAVLSTAYFFGHSTKELPRNYEKVMAVNNRVAEVVAKYPNLLVGFFSVNPLANTALREIKRCARLNAFVGLKLQLANSEVDLRNPAHVERLVEVFELANSLDMAAVIHMRTRRMDYGYKDAKIFIEQVLSKVPHMPIQVAHLAGWGGYDPATDAALSAFIDRKAQIKDNVYFDISAVVRKVSIDSSSASTASNWWPKQRYSRLVERLRKLGLEQVVFGTDWPEWEPQDYWNDLKKNLPLTVKEFKILRSNRAPWFR